jgi:hypothetical protein
MIASHPLFAALDAAVAEHGWPDGVYSIYGNTHGHRSIGLNGTGLPDGYGKTYVQAAAMGDEAKRRLEQTRNDDAAAKRLRELALANGINPGLVRL